LRSGERNVVLEESGEIGGAVVFTLEFSDGVRVVSVGGNKVSGNVVSGTDDDGGDILIRGESGGTDDGLLLDFEVGDSDKAGNEVDVLGDFLGKRVRSEGSLEDGSRSVLIVVELNTEDFLGLSDGD